MDRYFLSRLVFVLTLCCSVGAMARCPLGDYFAQKQDQTRMRMMWQVCATHYNDDLSQYKLAEAYEKGLDGFEKDEGAAIYYYQLAAESGHAEAQVRLAELFTAYDKTPEGRQTLLDYQKKLVLKSKDDKGFKGDFMHPYALLILASESPDKKWYYPSSNRIAPTRTLSLLNGYKTSEKTKKKALLEASKWKTRKLLETAKEVVPSNQYEEMVKKLKSPTTQAAAMTELKKYMDEYIQDNKR